LTAAVDVNADLTTRAFNIRAVINATYTFAAALSLSAYNLRTGVTDAGSLLTGEAWWTVHTAAEIRHTNPIDAGLKQPTADLGAHGDTLAIAAKLAFFALS
tara:strand:- start:401 stop:703 length:303 start_codon:yes stop_codon:yes gene_type:complete